MTGFSDFDTEFSLILENRLAIKSIAILCPEAWLQYTAIFRPVKMVIFN